MSLPASWVESLFAKLTVRYGAPFMRQYADLDMTAVKADWADVLGPLEVNPAALRYGLENLPVDKPPNAMQFKAICNLRPDAPALAITNQVLVEREQIDALVASVPREQTKDYKAWAKALKAREESGERLSAAQRDAWRRALVEAEA